jgi:hypothetical protein
VRHLNAQLYDGATLIDEASPALSRMRGVNFKTYYPGGIYGDMSGEIPFDIAHYLPVQGSKRLVLRFGHRIVYEGYVDDITRSKVGTSKIAALEATGAWGKYFLRRYLNKPWADTRIDETVWYPVKNTYLERYTYSRVDGIKIIPKNDNFGNWASGGMIRYTPPTGQTIKRITFDFDLQEGAQAWTLRVYDETNATALWTRNTTGTGSQNITLGTASSSIRIELISNAVQTGISDGTIYGELTNIVVYTETGNINPTEIARDIRALVTDLNSFEGMIGSNTLSLVPFITEGFEPLANILMRACWYGDASYNPWAVYLDNSEVAPTPDGKPVLVLEQQPTTAYYTVRIEEMAEGFEYNVSYADLINYVVIKYQDYETGAYLYVTPENDANLTDAASVAQYGRQEPPPIDIGVSTQSQAVQFGRRVLAQYKDPLYRVSQPVKVRGRIRLDGGNSIPVAMARAGKIVRLEGYASGLPESGVLLPVTATEYDDETDTVTLYSGNDFSS